MSRPPTAAQKRERINPFSLSFLDIISCGFGAVVVLILIFRFDPFPNDVTAPPPTNTTAAYNSILAEAAVSEKTEQAKGVWPLGPTAQQAKCILRWQLIN